MDKTVEMTKNNPTAILVVMTEKMKQEFIDLCPELKDRIKVSKERY